MFLRLKWFSCLRKIRLRRICARRRFWPAICSCFIGTAFFFFAIASLTYVFRFQLFEAFVKCSKEESRTYINECCLLYKEGKITGSLCSPLCETDQVRFDECTDFHAGKRVDLMTCSDYCVEGETIPAVLKSSDNNISYELHSHQDNFPEAVQTENFSRHLFAEISKLLYWELGFAPFASDADMLQLIWEKNYAKFILSPQGRQATYRTVMMLMVQSEYKIVKAMESTGIVPRIYGSCGPLYLQESCPPGLLDAPFVSVTKAKMGRTAWHNKAKTVIQLLLLLQRLEQELPEVLHLCDVKGSNFGICADGRVKVIDADSVFFHTRMMETFNTSECKTNEDCHFFDCGGWCHVEKGQCYLVLTNNNLQTVCRDVLFGPVPKLLDWGAVLSDAPASVTSKLDAALQECLAQTSEEGPILLHKPPLLLLTRLIHLLNQSLANEDVL